MCETVIKVENVFKRYRMGVIGHGTLMKDIQSFCARLFNTDDPNSTIGNDGQDTNGDDQFWALKDISFEVKKGEVLGIIGRNGSGKSTILKIMSRVTTPTRGQIKTKGKMASMLEVGTGFHPELTGAENVYLNGSILGMSQAEIKNKFDEIVDFSGVRKFIDTPVKRYSSGMYVRLAFSVAVHLDPEILLVDEVLAVGDVDFGKKCVEKMRQIAQSGKTVVLVSHNTGTILDLCERTILLKEGLIERIGPAEEVVDYYLSSAY